MTDTDTLRQILEAGASRRAERRRFLALTGQAAIAGGAASLLAACGSNSGSSATPTPTPTATVSPTPTPTATGTSGPSDADVLNFALNLEYLEAQFYSWAATGAPLDSALLTGIGTQGAVTGGAAVDFSGDALVGQYAREIAADELNHVKFLRAQLGLAVVAQPALDISGSATGPFTAVARAAGFITASETFNPYASVENFLLGAFIFEDVGVTAYKGASILIGSPVFIEAAAGILAAEAYHAGLIRSTLFAKGITTEPGQISNARDMLDGPTNLDQGIAGTATASNIVPADNDAIAYSRTAGQVLNIAYVNSGAVVGGGFFPAGVNGNIKTSAASA